MIQIERMEAPTNDGGRSRYSDVDELEEGQIWRDRRRDKDDFSKDKGSDKLKDEVGQGKGGGAAGATNVEDSLPPPPPPDNLNLGRTGGVYIPPFKLART